MEKTYENIKNISKNYFEGLEWVYRYYNEDCPDWTWKYNYHYPPLFSDLCKFIPQDGVAMVSTTGEAVTPTMQLCYVLPRANLYLLPPHVEESINNKYSHLYPENFEFKWAFCRYFWEAHPVLPEITLDVLKKIENGP
jgi:5'-3' exoribonuclease 1